MDENQNSSEDIGSDIANQMGGHAKKAGSQLARKAGNALVKVGKKLVQQAVKMAIKVLMQVLIAILPYLGIIFLILFIAVGAYYVLFETRGTLQEYSFSAKTNSMTTTSNQNNSYFTSSSLSSDNSEIQNFYHYYSTQSYYQILPGKTKPQKPDGTVTDYYNKEQEFMLSTDFLWSLDEYMFKGQVKYPEQFVQPVDYDSKTLTLKQLTNSNHQVDAKSKSYTNGKPNGGTTDSVSDYGLASIFKYEKAKKVHSVQGYYYSEQVYDAKSKSIKTVPIHESYNVVMSGFPQDIYLMTKAITFQGNHNFVYQIQTHEYAPLQVGRGAADTAMTEVPYATVKVGKGKSAHMVTLYKYRKGAVYETIPVQTADNFQNEGNQYLQDYLTNFEAWVPTNVMKSFNFDAQVGQLINTHMSVGSLSKSQAFTNSMRFFNYAQEYGNMFGVDPYLIIAQMSQESGGNPNQPNGYGLMQITGHIGETWTATTTSGQPVSVHITQAVVDNPQTNIELGTMYLANEMKKYNGDPLKALQAYNFGDGTMEWIQQNYPQDWNTISWMNHREAASEYEKEVYNATHSPPISIFGDPLYVEHVLQYYAGNAGYSQLNNHSAPGSKSWLQQVASEIKNAVTTAVSSVFEPNYSSPSETYQKVTNGASTMDYDWLLRMANAMSNETPFSDNSSDVSHVWDTSYDKSASLSELTKKQLANINPDVSNFGSPVNVNSPTIVSPFGQRINPVTGVQEFNNGVDISLPSGTPVYAVASGQVEDAVGNQTLSMQGYGNYVKINHEDGAETLYAHLSQVVVSKSQLVQKGQLIGYSGESGQVQSPLLHFELYLSGIPVDDSSLVNGAKLATQTSTQSSSS